VKQSNSNDSPPFNTLPSELVRVIAANNGVDSIDEEAANYVAEDVVFRLKNLILDGLKFMEHGRRKKLHCSDTDNALRVRNMEPIQGLMSRSLLPFRHTSGGGRELSWMVADDAAQDITELTLSAIPKAYGEPSFRAHWLAIEGMQPAVPENPPPYSKADQREDSVDPARKLMQDLEAPKKSSVVYINKTLKSFTVEHDVYRQLATHEPSVEQQLYYKEITEACVGSDESRRTEALLSLSTDPGLYDIVPRLTTFIAEGVRVNVIQKNLALLIYLMRMVKALLENQTLNLEKYLHDIIPSVATCIVSKQLCVRPEVDNHWALRDFAARLMAQVCRNFTSSSNNIQTRMTRIFSKALMSNTADDMSLASVYGAITGLGELGPEVVTAFIIPKLKYIGERISHSSGPDRPLGERKSASQVKEMVMKHVTPALKDTWNLQENLDKAQEQFGEYLAPLIIMSIVQSKAQEAKKVSEIPAPQSP
ncbi:unnamed protein product, partial [Allacma fusca]